MRLGWKPDLGREGPIYWILQDLLDLLDLLDVLDLLLQYYNIIIL